MAKTKQKLSRYDKQLREVKMHIVKKKEIDENNECKNCNCANDCIEHLAANKVVLKGLNNCMLMSSQSRLQEFLNEATKDKNLIDDE